MLRSILWAVGNESCTPGASPHHAGCRSRTGTVSLDLSFPVPSLRCFINFFIYNSKLLFHLLEQ